MGRRLFPVSLSLLLVCILPQASLAQTAVTYHLHNEPSTINAAKQLKVAGPDVAAVVRRSTDLKGSSSNWFLILDYFETQTGVPNVAGTIPAGSVVTFSIWLRKTTPEGTFHPTASLHFNQYWGPVPGLCSAGQGTDSTLPKLTTTFTKYTFSCTISDARTITTADRFYAQVGAWVDSAPAHKSVQVELGLEGLLNGNYDSTIVVPFPPAPVVTAITPSAGPVGQSVTIDGSSFGSTQGSSTVTFNGTAATATSWSDTRIIAPVPTGATTGPLVVTVNGRASNGVSFTVATPPAIASLNPASGIIGQQVTIGGTNFGATQGSSTVAFNGVTATAASWSVTSVVTNVPSGATTGPVIVTVNGLSSQGVAFTVIPPPGITSVTPASAAVGQAVTVSGANFGSSQGSSTVSFNGIAATATSWSSSTIGTTVPGGATTGPIVVTVNGQSSNAAAFAVLLPPHLTAIEPASGVVGQSVTLTGTNFGPGTPSVTFDGIAATVTTATATTIAVTVPALATSGPVVVVANGLSSNALAFSVLTTATGTVTVRTYLFDEAAPGGQGPPAGAGVYVRIDGVDVGQTLDDGTLTVEVAVGDRVVTAIEPSLSVGEAPVTVSAGAAATVSVVLLDGKDVVEPTELTIDEMADGIVPIAPATFTMRFRNGAAAAPVTRLRSVEVIRHEGKIEYTITSMFTIAQGAIVATDPEFMLLWVPSDEQAVLRVQAVDANGFTHDGDVQFSKGQYTLNVTLSAPPSDPGLAVSGRDVSVAVVGTPIVLQRTSDAQGRISIPLLPFSTVVVSSTAIAGGNYYYAWSTLLLEADTSATFVLRNVVDVLNDVPPITIGGAAPESIQSVSLTANGSARPSPYSAARQEMIEKRRATAGSRQSPSNRAVTTAAAATTSLEPVTLTVTTDGADEPVYQNATLNVPQGTEKVTLKYNVLSLEYPDWVQKQSPFDDVWRLSVYGPGGQQLFETWRNVNSQQSGDPAWQGDATTGDIQEEFDVTDLAADGSIQLTMVASAVNVMDFLFDTTVTAELGAVAKLTIDTADKDTVTPTRGKSEYVSIPRDPATNHYERWFTLKVTKPKPEATITKVRVSLRSSAGSTLQELFEEAPGQNVKLENGGATIKVRVTMHTVQSTVPSTPPTTHGIRYRFTVQADVDGQSQWSEPKDSEEMFALWRMPSGLFNRYGQPPDTGLDDWASRGAYDWLTRNAGLFTNTSINDISGEHARDIIHKQHYRGVEIDIFQFKRFDGAWNADSNYKLLRKHVLDALNGNLPAKALVSDWVTKTRTGYDAFLPLADVEKLYTTIGSEHNVGGVVVLPDGWGRELIKNGTFTIGIKTLDLGIGVWSNATNAKMIYNDIHNDHGHITLDITKLIK